jgi:hypothetical protein
MSVAVGATHGDNPPDDLPTPKGLNVVGRRVGREKVRTFGVREGFW